MSQEAIHEVVRNRYGAIARAQDSSIPVAASCCGSSSSSCCGGAAEGEAGCGVGGGLYDAQALEGLPVDVTGLSLGCEGTQFTRSNTSCCAA